jgi:hypothetical protein
LAVLAVLLYLPGNLDKTGSLEGIFIQFFDYTLPLIVEDEVIGTMKALMFVVPEG